jgi:hypothetical protein
MRKPKLGDFVRILGNVIVCRQVANGESRHTSFRFFVYLLGFAMCLLFLLSPLFRLTGEQGSLPAFQFQASLSLLIYSNVAKKVCMCLL